MNLTNKQIKDAYAELKNELAKREHFYPMWVKQGKKRKNEADKQLQNMKLAITLFENAYPIVFEKEEPIKLF